MNRTKIEWCDYTWNPVTGCYHGCEYCYARRIAHRFARKEWQCKNCIVAPNCSGMVATNVCGGVSNYTQYNQIHDLNHPVTTFYPGKKVSPYPFEFEPTFHRYRLREPGKRNKPTKIFVSSMGDLFGDWVPEEWIREVIHAVWKYNQHNFMFLTKNPKRYKEFIWPDNCWLGTSLSSSKYIDRAWELLKLPKKYNTFMSIEPLLGPVNLNKYEILLKNWRDKLTIGKYIDWIIVGAQTGPGAVKSSKEWIELIIEQCKRAEVPLFLKDNLEWPEKIQEWPEVMK